MRILKLCLLVLTLFINVQAGGNEIVAHDSGQSSSGANSRGSLIGQVFNQNPQIHPTARIKAQNILMDKISQRPADNASEEVKINEALRELQSDANYFRRAIATYLILGDTIELDIKENLKTIFNSENLLEVAGRVNGISHQAYNQIAGAKGAADRLSSFFSEEQWQRLINIEKKVIDEEINEQINRAVAKTQAIFEECLAEDQDFLEQPLELMAEVFARKFTQDLPNDVDQEAIANSLVEAAKLTNDYFFEDQEQFEGAQSQWEKLKKIRCLMMSFLNIGTISFVIGYAIHGFSLATNKYLFDGISGAGVAVTYGISASFYIAAFLYVAQLRKEAPTWYSYSCRLRRSILMQDPKEEHSFKDMIDNQKKSNALHDQEIRNNILNTVLFADINPLVSAD